MNKSDEKELLFVPLGGTEEIGMNFNLYGLGSPDQHDWLIIDLGITFGDDSTPVLMLSCRIQHLSRNAGKIYLALF